MEKINERLLFLSEVKNYLSKRKAEGELSYEQEETLDYASKFSSLSAKRANELKEELEKYVKEEATIYTIINMMPTKEALLKNCFPKGKLPEDKTIKSIAKLIKKYGG